MAQAGQPGQALRLPQCHRDCGTAFQTSTSVTASGTVRVRLRLPVGLGRSPGVTAVTVRLDMVRDSESEAVNWAASWGQLLGSVQPGLPGRPSLPGWTKPVWRPPGESGLRWRPAVWPGRSTLPQKWVLTVIRIDQMRSDVLNRHFLDSTEFLTNLEGKFDRH